MFAILKKAIQRFYFNNQSVNGLLLHLRSARRALALDYELSRQRYRSKELELKLSLMKGVRPLKVVFLVTENAKWNVQSVYEALDGSSAFEPLILTFPGYRTRKTPVAALEESERVNFDFFSERGMRVAHGYSSAGGYVDLEQLEPDIVFYEQPHQFLPERLWVRRVGEYALTCYIGYGVMIAKIQQLQFNREFHHRLWRIFAETEMHRELFAKYSAVGDGNVVVTGHPKLDVYLSEAASQGDALWAVDRTERPQTKRVVWAPHFSIKNREVAFSTFHRYYRFFFDLAQRESRLDWIIKPHPWLRSACVKYGLMSRAQVDAYFAAWDELPNARVYEQGDYFEIFKSSDAMILDSVSFVAEYMPTECPMLFLVNKEPPLVGFNEFGDALQAGLYKARTTGDIEAFISNTVIGDSDPLRSTRKGLAERILAQPTGGAGGAVRDYLARRLTP